MRKNTLFQSNSKAFKEKFSTQLALHCSSPEALLVGSPSESNQIKPGQTKSNHSSPGVQSSRFKVQGSMFPPLRNPWRHPTASDHIRPNPTNFFKPLSRPGGKESEITNPKKTPEN
jgi:hypothetical protein